MKKNSGVRIQELEYIRENQSVGVLNPPIHPPVLQNSY